MRVMQQQLGNLGTISAFACRHRETKKNLCRGGRSQDLPDTDFKPAVRHLKQEQQYTHRVHTVYIVRTVHTVHRVHTVYTVRTVHTVHTVNRVRTVHTVGRVRTLHILYSVPIIHTVYTVYIIRTAHTVRTVHAVQMRTVGKTQNLQIFEKCSTTFVLLEVKQAPYSFKMLVFLFEFLHSVMVKCLDVSDERNADIFWVKEFIKVDTVQKHKTRQSFYANRPGVSGKLYHIPLNSYSH